MSEPRRCQALNKRGDPCRNTGVLEDGYCSVHSPTSPIRHQFEPGHPPYSPGRTPRPRWHERVAAQLDQRIEKVFGVWDGAMDAERFVILPGGVVEREPHHAIRLQGAGELVDRAAGKPRTALELSGPDGDPLQAVVLHKVLEQPDARMHAAELARRLAIETTSDEAA